MTGRRQAKTIVCGTAVIVLFVIVPSIRAVWLNASNLMAHWQPAIWYTPALYLYGFASMMAIAMPVGAAVRCLALVRAHDAGTQVLWTMLGVSLGIALGAALFWQLLAWASYPIFRDGHLRLLPFFPWPDSSFWRHFLHFAVARRWFAQEYRD